MSTSRTLHQEADRLAEMAATLEEIRKVLFEQVRVLRFNADLQWRSEQRAEERQHRG